jgi:alkylhydroperoxidase/carboxymuconolactone decarboxylase family protein YurZ
MPGTSDQLQFHLGAAMNAGLTVEQLKNFIVIIESKVGKREAESVNAVLHKILSAGSR